MKKSERRVSNKKSIRHCDGCEDTILAILFKFERLSFFAGSLLALSLSRILPHSIRLLLIGSLIGMKK